MKKRRIAIACFLLVACMTIGIGFAALTGSLTIGGKVNAGIHSDNFKVILVQGEETTVDKSGTAITNPVGEGATPYYVYTYGPNSTSVTITVNEGVLRAAGDKVVMTFKVKNESATLHAKLTPQTITHDNDEYFEVTTTAAVTELTEAGTATDSTTVTVTVELLKTLSNTNRVCDFSLIINTEAVEVDHG